jgi:hypothetical protein
MYWDLVENLRKFVDDADRPTFRGKLEEMQKRNPTK